MKSLAVLIVAQLLQDAAALRLAKREVSGYLCFQYIA